VHYVDDVHGSAEIDDPILLDLIASQAVQRLRGILQAGITALLGITHPTTRFDHSLGVMLVVRNLGGSVEEQIAALLHDVSHTAFSHVIDHVFDSADRQSFHDDQKEAYLAATDVPAICARHGYDWRDFLHEEAFPLLEQPAPALCADRVDYFLRDALHLRILSQPQVAHILQHLTVHDGRIVFTTQAAARLAADHYMKTDEACWANFWEVGLYELTARAIRRGLDVGALTMDDIWGIDADAWAKLTAHPDPELRRRMALVSAETHIVWDEQHPTFRVSTKLRTLDPAVLVNGSAAPLSQLDPAYGRKRDSYLVSKRGAWPMRVIPRETPD
jgi:hypothetical protein